MVTSQLAITVIVLTASCVIATREVSKGVNGFFGYSDLDDFLKTHSDDNIAKDIQKDVAITTNDESEPSVKKRSPDRLKERRLWLLRLLKSRMALRRRVPKYQPAKRQRLSINGALSSLADMLEAQGRQRYNNEMSYTHQRLLALGKRGGIFAKSGNNIPHVDGLSDDVMTPENSKGGELNENQKGHWIPIKYNDDKATMEKGNDAAQEEEQKQWNNNKRARFSINGPLSSLVDMLDNRERDMVANRLRALGRR